ncbi:MAG TPA: hypothetical protein VFV87_02410, partial [Pirellulaceae bacterium]|nr:hypothetical protein [Pirellulaceae bacterium]
LWLDGKRPAALLCLISKGEKWNFEFHSLLEEPLRSSDRGKPNWQPAAAARAWVAVEGAVPEASRARQLALRGIARRFEASETRQGEKFPLRLQDRPLYTYADADNGVIDGGLFAMSYGTNPELLLQIEARKGEDKPEWHVAFARLSAAEVIVQMATKEAWRADAIPPNSYKPADPYYAYNEVAAPE